MCGLGGVASLGTADLTLAGEQTLRRMLATLAHRGPDAERIRVHGSVGMAFTRLSLVDVEGGSQPLTNHDSSVALIANGEIYNHRELAARLPHFAPRTRSDCEVLIGLYERHHLDFLDEVRGIFSLALHDTNRNTLVLASDPFATKPMYYYRGAREVIFGSEIKALWDWPGTPRRLDWPAALRDQGITNRVAMTTEPANTWFEGIQRVDGGTIVIIDLATGATKIHRYWRPAQPLPTEDAPSSAEYVGRYRELLYSAVEDSLMADVELGLFLSGGVDSAAIAAIAQGHGQRLHTFTAATGSTLANGDVANAQRTAKLLGLPNSLAVFDSSAIPSGSDWKSLVWLLETPLVGAEQYYKYQLYRTAKQIRPDLKAMLLGAGADEFNGGYSEMLAGGDGWPGFVRNLARMDAGADAALEPWTDGELGCLVDPDAVTDHTRAGSDPYRTFVLWKWRDVQQYNCWHEDRTAAGNGVEARVPFLDRRLVDLALSVPRSMREALLWDKRMAREAVGSALPTDLRLRPKQPFFHGPAAHFAHRTLISMLLQNDRELVHEALSASGASNYLVPAAIHAALDQMAADSYQDQVDLPLRLVNLGLLELAVGTPPPPFEPTQVTLRATVLVEPDPDEVYALLSPTLSVDTVLRYARSARLMYEPHRDVWHLSIDGSLHFEVAAGAEPEWIALLGAIDGERTLAELLRQSQADHNKVQEYLQLCVDEGFLVVQQAAEHYQNAAVR